MVIFRKKSRLARTVPVTEVRSISGAFVLDVREPDEFAGGTIPGAINIPLGALPHRLAEIPRDRTIACLCRSGNRSGKAQALLLGEGYDAVNLTGGMLAWKGGQ